MGTLETLKKRKTVIRYDKKKPDWRKILRAIDYARYSPKTGTIFNTKFLLLQKKDLIEKIAEIAQQPHIKNAHYLVIATSNNTQLERLYREKAEHYSTQHTGAAINNFLLGLTEQRLVTKWVRYYHEETIKNLLNIPEKEKIEGLFPIGKETKINTQKENYPLLENILYFDEWGNKKMVPEKITTHQVG